MITTVYLASDHGGFELKEKIKVWLMENHIPGEDLGAYTLNPDDDYPDFILPLATKVASDPESLGIVLGRSGNGEALAANKVSGARAVVCLNEEMARKAREHNDANILSLGADYIDLDLAKKIVKVFIETPFSEERRHLRRLQEIENFEKFHE